MQSSVRDELLPIRIGAIVPDAAMICEVCSPEFGPHTMPRCRFALLVWMPVMTKAPQAMPTVQFIGGPRTPPLAINGVQAINHQGVERFMRFIHCN